MKHKTILLLASLFVVGIACKQFDREFSVNTNIDYCEAQALRTLAIVPSGSEGGIPNSIDGDDVNWHFTSPGSWTSGFWPGILWYLYENTKDNMWKVAAENYTQKILPVTHRKARSHDMGFITMCSLGNGYRLTGNTEYKEGLLRAADSLSILFNPEVGTFLSWPGMVKKENWPHNTIIDNMMNLELLFWVARNGGERRLYDMACEHADTTMKYQFRKDYSCYHVAVYDTITGHFIKGVTHQGLSDNSMWARGQAWAIYGYTMVYRETGEVRFLNFARKVADAYLSRLPEDLIPYWDFDAPDLSSGEPKDASAAAITASALLELSTYVTERDSSHYYYDQAEKMLEMLSSSAYKAGDTKYAFLLHSVGHMPRGGEVDASIIYADYYYLEALIRFKRLQEKRSILANL